ncbi:hypothetical protein ACSBR1_013924 [Camellia fascicularis]
MSNKNLGTRTLLDEIPNFDKGSVFFDLDHPLLNRIAHSFIKAAGIGAIQAVSREAYFTALEGTGLETGRVPPEITTGLLSWFDERIDFEPNSIFIKNNKIMGELH